MILNTLAASLLLVSTAQDLGEGAAVQPDPFATFAEAIEVSIAVGDGDYLTESIDLAALSQLISKGIDTPRGFKKDFFEGVKRSLQFGQQVVDNNLNFDGTYEFLRIMPDAPRRALPPPRG